MAVNPSLLESLLQEQQLLTPVAQFARQHGGLPDQARFYSQLLPLEAPGPGQQYAFGVDLDACTGCKACVSACHSLNGLDEDEIWRNVGFIHGGTTEAAYQQTVTTACHHCVDPGCLHGCPVLAYEKDPETGIVHHLDDQCIGCQYCVLKCPYDVPKYSKKRGIVRKCDMCRGRLADGEAPACVQACPTAAISIRVIDVNAPRPDRMLPGAFESSYTGPTTAYWTRKPIPENALPADSKALRLEDPHLPLVAMLVLTQMAAGLVALVPILEFSSNTVSVLPLASAGFLVLNAGLAVSILHLGRPSNAWRAFLGLRTSWMSREIVAFGAFSAVAGLSCAASAWPRLHAYAPALARLIPLGAWAPAFQWACALLGLGSVFCSAMVYVDTRRPAWDAKYTLAQFFSTGVLLGFTAGAWIFSLFVAPLAFKWTCSIAALHFSVWMFDGTCHRWAVTCEEHPRHRMALVIKKLLLPWSHIQQVLAGSAAALATLALGLPIHQQNVCLGGALLLATASQLLARTFYFTACPAPRMPGGFHP